MVKPVVFQIAGYQNSGKTTLSLQLVESFHLDGYQVATIKHHGHGGKPDIVEGKDSQVHMNAGASVSLVEGEGRILLQAERKNWTIEEEISILSVFHPDIILIEGYKKKSFPKALLLRDEQDLNLLEELKNVHIIFYRDTNLAKILSKQSIPFFEMGDKTGLEWIKNFISVQFSTNK